VIDTVFITKKIKLNGTEITKMCPLLQVADSLEHWKVKTVMCWNVEFSGYTAEVISKMGCFSNWV
jgi:hypothetical protein